MPASFDEIDRLIADTEQAILEQVFRILTADAAGLNTIQAKRALRAVESILALIIRPGSDVLGRVLLERQ